MNVLLIGSGGRESALAWKLSQSPKLSSLTISPGNSGTSQFGHNVHLENDNETIKFAKENSIDLTIVGPEEPLSKGIVDKFRLENLRIFGPSKRAARIESSKIWAKKLFIKYGIPTAKSKEFNKIEDGYNFLKASDPKKWVIKVDGLAAGKGVFLPEDLNESKIILEEIFLNKSFGSSGESIIIEEKLFGIELSVFAFVQNSRISNIIPACDYKRSLEMDQGSNTGGMGAISPPPIWNKGLEKIIQEKVMVPVVNAMEKEGCGFTGLLFGGLILTESGIKVLEFNCRFGDPETQVIVPRIESDLLEICYAIADTNITSSISVKLNSTWTVGVVIASGGYPAKYRKGYEVFGVDMSNNIDANNSLIFQAGTKLNNESKIVTDGGRVLICIGMANNLKHAQKVAYERVNLVSFKNMQYRKDIGEHRTL